MAVRPQELGIHLRLLSAAHGGRGSAARLDVSVSYRPRCHFRTGTVAGGFAFCAAADILEPGGNADVVFIPSPIAAEAGGHVRFGDSLELLEGNHVRGHAIVKFCDSTQMPIGSKERRRLLRQLERAQPEDAET